MSKLRVTFRFGLSLIKLFPGYVAAYLIFSFISQTAVPLALPLLLAEVTNRIQVTTPAAARTETDSAHVKDSHKPQANAEGTNSAAPGNHPIYRPQVLPPYLLWVLLTFLLIPLGIGFRLAQTDMDNRMEKYLRMLVFDKVVRQPPEFFYKYNPGELTNVLTQSTVEAQQAARSLTVDPILQLASLCTATVLIVYELRTLRPELVWPAIAAMVVFGVVSVWLLQVKGEKPIYKAQFDVQQQRFALSGLADSAVKSPEEIQAMNAESLFGQRYEQALDRFMGLKRRQALSMELVNSGLGLPTQVILAAFYGLLVYQAVNGASYIEPGVFIALAGLTPQLMLPFRTFAALGIIASSSLPAVQLISGLLGEENRIKDIPGAKSVDKLEPTVEVRDVAFTYPAKPEPVFKSLNFNLPPAKITGLVARMGQGKTTFFRLALRFYDPQAGDIRLGGFPTTSLKVQSLREHVVMMSQFPAFFHDSVRDNFRVAKPNATDDEIQKVCELTGIWPILQAAPGPDPLDRPFAAGMPLSGGQKRLFALARCLLREPTFLLLDEPTTNMDNDEKYSLIPLMRQACVGRTVIVIDHDLRWLVRFCDHFVTLHGGRVAQQGTAEQLLAQDGILRELYDLTDSHSAPVVPRQDLAVPQRAIRA